MTIKTGTFKRETTHPAFPHANVLVTGASGFIASHLIEALVPLAASVRAFVHYNSRSDLGLLSHLPVDTLNHVDILAGDLRDLSAVQQAMHKIDLAFHLGALISIPYSYRHPADVVEVNVLGALNVLIAARDRGVSRLVHTSTSEVYGSALRIPIDESHPFQAQSPYAASKIGADKLVESFHRSYDLPLVTLRPFNTYGPRQSARAVVPTIIAQALTQEVVRLGNLDARRDFTFVSDTVEGFLRVAQTPGVEGMVFNLGSGAEISIGDLTRRIVDLTGRSASIQVDQARLRPERSEVRRLLADASLAHQMLGWAPQVPLDQGLLRTIDWIAAHLEHYRPGEYVL